MYTNFDAHLGVDQTQISQDFIVITDTDIDGNFLLHHFISNFLQKRKGRVCLLGFAQTQSHYTSACHKMGVNLQTANTKKDFVFVDMLRMIYDGFMAETADSNNLFSDVDSLKPLMELVNVIVAGDSPSLVVVDDISTLVNIGVPVQIIADFLHYCKTLITQKDVTFVFLSHADTEDPELSLLHCWLKRYVTLEINVRALKSGFSKELSGDMSITHNNKQHTAKHLHFKLLDKDVKFYAPGTASVVL